MKRDMELVRKILFLAEEEKSLDELSGLYDDALVAGHVAILTDAELVLAAVANGSDGKPIAADIIRLTWAGHEFIDNARNDTLWRKAMDKIGNISTSVSFNVLTQVLTSLTMQAING